MTIFIRKMCKLNVGMDALLLISFENPTARTPTNSDRTKMNASDTLHAATVELKPPRRAIQPAAKKKIANIGIDAATLYLKPPQRPYRSKATAQQ